MEKTPRGDYRSAQHEQPEMEGVKTELVSNFEASLNILPMEEDLIQRISEARLMGNLKKGAADAELLALRMEMEYTVKFFEADQLDLNAVAKMIKKMKDNLDESLQGRRFETILWNLEGLEDMLAAIRREKESTPEE